MLSSRIISLSLYFCLLFLFFCDAMMLLLLIITIAIVTIFVLGVIQIEKVVDVCKELISTSRIAAADRVTAKEIGVIAAFRQQVLKIRLRLRAEGLFNVNVGSVEDFQVIYTCLMHHPFDAVEGATNAQPALHGAAVTFSLRI